MRERVWYKSLYWRIALGYIALLALLLLVQTGLSVWLTNRMWGRANRTPEQLAEMVAQDLSAELARSPQTDIERHLRDKYGVGYQPFVVVLAGEMRRFSNRPTAASPLLCYAARPRLAGRDPDPRRLAADPPRPPPADFAEVPVNRKP